MASIVIRQVIRLGRVLEEVLPCLGIDPDDERSRFRGTVHGEAGHEGAADFGPGDPSYFVVASTRPVRGRRLSRRRTRPGTGARRPACLASAKYSPSRYRFSSRVGDVSGCAAVIWLIQDESDRALERVED